MNADKMYIPNMEKWSKYYQNVIQGKSNAYITHMQNGSFMIPIEKPSTQSSTTTNSAETSCNVRLVSPTAQMVEMAKESLEDEGVYIKEKKRKRKISHKPTNDGVGRKKKKKSEKKRDIFSP